jgi:GGDEF domain-containing protein
MRDARHGVDLNDGPWPAAVIEGLPVGLLEVDARGRVVRANAELARLLAVAVGDGERWPPPDPGASRFDAVGADGAVDGPRVTDRWPHLAEATVAVLSGRSVDCLVATPFGVLRVRGVPRWSGPPPHGGLLVVSDGSADGPAVVDLRDGATPGATSGATSGGGPGGMPEVTVTARAEASTPVGQGVEPARWPGPGWLRPSLGGGRRRQQAARADEHAATHDPLTGLPNQVLLLQCLADALAACRPGRRVAVLTLEVRRAVLRTPAAVTEAGADTGSYAAPDVGSYAVPDVGSDAGTLQRLAVRLSQLAGPQDVVARLEGRRFALLLPEVSPGTDLELLATRLADRLSGPADAPAGHRRAESVVVEGPGIVLADPASGAVGDRDPRWVLALALEALERSRAAGRPVIAPELPSQAERARVAALGTYDVHDSALDDVLHAITQVAATACDAYAALLTFVDSDLQWIRAATGVDVSGLADGHGPRHLALCDRTIRGREVLVVPDTERDPGFRSSRHVGWQVGMRFYAGAPLLTPEGRAIGTLCVFDTLPRELLPRQRQSLTVLAAETVALLEAHRSRG